MNQWTALSSQAFPVSFNTRFLNKLDTVFKYQLFLKYIHRQKK